MVSMVPTITANYKQLFVAGGSRYLTNLLNISCEEKNHAFWDGNLIWANTPVSIDRFGYTWRFDKFMI